MSLSWCFRFTAMYCSSIGVRRVSDVVMCGLVFREGSVGANRYTQWKVSLGRWRRRNVEKPSAGLHPAYARANGARRDGSVVAYVRRRVGNLERKVSIDALE